MTLVHQPPPTTQTQCQQYLSCYWSDFDQILKIGVWEYIQQVKNVTVTFVQVTFVLATFVHIMNISAVTDLILTKRFLWALIILELKFWTYIFWPYFLWTQNILDSKFFWIQIF